ncbi:PEP-CTERM sorting domain-containing protein [Ideonella livida]|uniref:PEP-CTERM sorting domain-containing protein n=1 Tax=Ideonella livida TaxID=2707176 RepID=A0A7C9TJS9_9BURK|nr:PEP-CTERM sorting domain-containing protein [Ideonella livida]NDY91264.1 PEP-CTERM sorting domain-containing protein [Ideonella livida]
MTSTAPVPRTSKTSLRLLAAGCAALAMGSAGATSQTFTFGTLLSGTGAPTTASFASLVVNEVDQDVQFTLVASNLEQLAGANDFIGSLAVMLEDGGSQGSVGTVSGLKEVKISAGGGPGGDWDFRFTLGKGNNDNGGNARLEDGESASWTWVGGAGQWLGFALHVQAIEYGNTTSAWYGATIPVTPDPPVTVVPEPAPAAMLAAGLALLGWRRRQARASRQPA